MNLRILVAALALPAMAWQNNGARPATVQPIQPRVETGGRPQFSWLLQAVNTPRRGLRQTAYRIVVASSQALIDSARGDLWDSGGVTSGATRVPYGGKPLGSMAEYFWKAQVWDQDGAVSAWSRPEHWRTGILRPEEWKAKWVGAVGEQTALPLFRRAFRVEKPVAAAIAYVSGLGQYELEVNGRKAGDAVLTPGWTDYRKTVYYNAYDVTGAIRSGENALGVMLGNGMYNVVRTPGRYTKFTGTFGKPKAIVKLHLIYADGTSEDIVSDARWKTHPGPIVFSSTYGGEDYDARLLPDGWDQAGFDDREWAAASEVEGPGGTLAAQENPDIQVMRTYRPVKVTTPKPGTAVYDLGQNFSGWPRITVKGPAGATLKLIPGELLDGAGLVTQQSSGGPQWFSYTLKGADRETWNPRFSYYGFRYVQVEGLDSGAAVADLEGQFLHANAERVGEFTSSNSLFNRIHTLIDAAIESNMQSVLTDCPHREKIGWLEESHLLGSAIMYNYDVSGLYRKIANDIRDGQAANGFVADFAPVYMISTGGFRDSPEWGSAAVLDPWLAYRHYGDRDILAAHYDEMKRYVDYLTSKASDGIVAYGLGDWYDIGPGQPGVSKLTSLGLTATAIYYADIQTLRSAALLLGKPEDAARLETMAGAVRQAFNAKLYDAATGVYDRGSQTAYAMPLALGLAPQERRGDVLDRLVADIRSHGNHTTAGDIGFHYVIQALGEGDRSAVIGDMLATTEPPSYGAQLEHGATSLTEAWDANPRSSQNHFMLGHAEEWFYRYLAGIDFDLSRAPGEQIVLRPFPVEQVTSARASYKSVLGTVVSGWKREGGTFVLDCEVPVNSSATVWIPTRDAASVQEGGGPAARASGVQFVRQETDAAVYRVASGAYHFEAR